MRQRFSSYAALLLFWPLMIDTLQGQDATSSAHKDRIKTRFSQADQESLKTVRKTTSVETDRSSAEHSRIDDAIRATLRTSPKSLGLLTQDALKLAAKGATHTARAKLIEVLDLATEQLDADEETTIHGRALSAGLLALQEAEDFIRPASTSTGPFTASVMAAAHTTPVLRERNVEQLTRIQALELYYSYASRQLAKALADAPEGSAALCHLGRLQPYLLDGSERDSSQVAARMVAWQRAALRADPENYRAANELGVVLANHGQLEAAKKALLCSMEIGHRAETITNLSVVMRKLGDESGARSMIVLAKQKRQQGQDNRESGFQPFVRWVDQRQFSASAGSDEIPTALIELPTHHSTAPANTGRAPKSTKSAWLRFPARWTNAARHGSSDGDQAPPKSSGQASDNSSIKVKTARAIQIEHFNADDENAVTAEDEKISEVKPVAFHTQSNVNRPQTPNEFVDGEFEHGEYIGPARSPHVQEYYLRVDDAVGFVYRMSGKPSTQPYRLNVGDVIRITSLTEDKMSLETLIQPDGTIVLPQVGSIVAAGKTIDLLRQELDERFLQFIREPSISITPVTINKTVEELRNSVIMRTGLFNGQMFSGKVAPNGTIQLPALGSVPAQGLSLDELRSEVQHRYAAIAGGLEVTPILQQRAPHYVYVLGEVSKPGRYDLTGPTSVIQSISLAGGWNKGGNLCEVIVLRRDECWRLLATRFNVRPALYNKPELEADDIWLRDSDIVIVPKHPLQVYDDWIEMIFTRGIYGVVPFNGITFSFFKDLSTLGILN